jgi:uncharacterized membrane protein
MARRLMNRIVVWQDVVLLGGLQGVAAIAIACWPQSPLRTVVSMFCLLFTPGYMVLAAIAPDKHLLTDAARFGLSSIVSIAALIPIGLLLNYSPWGLTVDTILGMLSGLFVILALAALWRRSRLAPQEQYSLDGLGLFRGVRSSARLFLTLTIMVFSLIGIVWGMMGTTIRQEDAERFSEFYLLGAVGTADEYPIRAVAGEPFPLTIGVVNHEKAAIEYHVILSADDGTLQRIASFPLSAGEQWEQSCRLILKTAGENRKVAILLFREGDSEPYRSLHLWIAVRDAP